jgi:hypothetical protein
MSDGFHGCNPCTSPVLSSQPGAIVVVTAEPQPFDLAVLPAVARGLGSCWPQRDDSKMAAVHLGAMLAVVVARALGPYWLGCNDCGLAFARRCLISRKERIKVRVSSVESKMVPALRWQRALLRSSNRTPARHNWCPVSFEAAGLRLH